jgi:RNA polymerase sigma-70 factor (ECF subfamily)
MSHGLPQPQPPDDSTSESTRLLLRAREGDRSAIDLLFTRYFPRIRRWAHGRLPSWARRLTDTGDIVQDAFLRTFRRLDRFEPRGNSALQAYLRQAVVNRIKDELRSARSQPQSELIDSQHSTQGPSTIDELIDAEDRERYRRALARLPETDRELLVSRLDLNYSYEQIALITSRATANAARVAVRRALVKLAEEMDRV